MHIVGYKMQIQIDMKNKVFFPPECFKNASIQIHRIFSMRKSYVMIQVIKHDMDPNSYLYTSRKTPPVAQLCGSTGLT